MLKLSAHEIACIQGVADGLPCKAIALQLGMSESAVKVLLYRARKRAGGITLYQLVALTIGLGICNLNSYELPAPGPQPLLS